MTRASFRNTTAFSLIEVTLALGLVAFCLVTLMGLMSVATDSIRQAELRAGASVVMRQVAVGIRGAQPDDSGRCAMTGYGPLDGVLWEANGTALAAKNGTINRRGTNASAASADYAYRLELQPPDAADPTSLGRAIIRLAWPAQATWSNNQWNGAAGSEMAVILFRAP